MIIQLKNKTAFITGSGRGIGREIALAFAEAGANIVATDIIEDFLTSVSSEINKKGVKILALKLDVTNYDEVEKAMEKAFNQFGSIDILVNNAGIARDNIILRLKEEDWDKVIDVNLKGVFNCIKAASKYMIKQRSGKIINISSVSGITGNIGQANYSASKAGVIALTKTVARELAPRGITVNAIAPGFITTDMTRAIDEKFRNEIINKIPLGRTGEPKDVASVALFLASDMANYVTGHTLVVDGGLVMG